MTTTIQPRETAARPVRNHRQTALVVGVLFLITYVTSIPAKFSFYPPLFENSEYVLTGAQDIQLLWGAFLELVLIIANIGTAVVLYPLLRRRHPVLSISFVTARVMESAFIAVGVLAVATLVTMRQDFAGTDDPQSLLAVGHALVALQEWTFNLGPGFVVGVGNGLILGWMMYRTGLVPRGLAMLGLVGGPLIVLQGTAILFGVIEPGSTWQVLATMPEFFWELSFGLYLIVKGFRPSPVLED